MDVIGLMATDAPLRCALVMLARMAGRAAHGLMLVGQGKTRAAMLEAGRQPICHPMTGGAVTAEIATMHILLAVAAGTAVRCLAVGLGRRMAAHASKRRVRPAQGKLAELVTEAGHTQLVDVRAAPEMLGVTAAALSLRRPRHAPVIAAAGADVGGNFLVTIQTQCALRIAVAAVMTEAAIAFQLGVRLRHRSRHDQLLDAGSAGGLQQWAAEQQREQRLRTEW